MLEIVILQFYYRYGDLITQFELSMIRNITKNMREIKKVVFKWSTSHIGILPSFVWVEWSETELLSDATENPQLVDVEFIIETPELVNRKEHLSIFADSKSQAQSDTFEAEMIHMFINIKNKTLQTRILTNRGRAKSRPKFIIKVTCSKLLVPSERPCHKDYTCKV